MQGNGFSLECVFKCSFKFPTFKKSLSYWMQRNGFSHECVLTCDFKVCPCQKVLPGQTFLDCKEMVFSPEGVFNCFFKYPQKKALLHWLQGNGFSIEYVLKCVIKCCPCEKDLGHWLQGNGFSLVCS